MNKRLFLMLALSALAWVGNARALTPVSTECLPGISRGQMDCWAIAETQLGDSVRGYGGWFGHTDYGKPMGYTDSAVAQTIIDVSKQLGRDKLGHAPFPYTKKIGNEYVETRSGGYNMLYDKNRPHYYRYAIPVNPEWLKPGAWEQMNAKAEQATPALAVEVHQLADQLKEIAKGKANTEVVAAIEKKLDSLQQQTMPGTAIQSALAALGDKLEAAVDKKLGEHRAEIDKRLEMAISGVDKQLNEMGMRIDANTGAIKKLDVRVTDIERETARLQQTVAENGQQLAEQATTIAANAEVAGGVKAEAVEAKRLAVVAKAETVAVKRMAETNTAKVADLSNRVGAMEGEVNGLNLENVVRQSDLEGYAKTSDWWLYAASAVAAIVLLIALLAWRQWTIGRKVVEVKKIADGAATQTGVDAMAVRVDDLNKQVNDSVVGLEAAHSSIKDVKDEVRVLGEEITGIKDFDWDAGNTPADQLKVGGKTVWYCTHLATGKRYAAEVERKSGSAAHVVNLNIPRDNNPKETIGEVAIKGLERTIAKAIKRGVVPEAGPKAKAA